MSLQEKLDAKKSEIESSAPQEALNVMHQSTEDLKESDIMNQVKTEGDTAPDFALEDYNGQSVNLSQRLADGPVVLGFYRGGWWPFCNIELDALETAHEQIKELGASLIMISPQSVEASRKFAETKDLTLDLLIDPGNEVAKLFGLVYTVPDDLRKVYKQLGIDLSKENADGSWELPMPARYIIDGDRKIRYAEVNPDYTVRPDPSHTIEALKKLQ